MLRSIKTPKLKTIRHLWLKNGPIRHISHQSFAKAEAQARNWLHDLPKVPSQIQDLHSPGNLRPTELDTATFRDRHWVKVSHPSNQETEGEIRNEAIQKSKNESNICYI